MRLFYSTDCCSSQIAGSDIYLNDTLATIKRLDASLLDVVDVTYHPYTYNPDDVVRYSRTIPCHLHHSRASL
jgi:hypothetical protein